MPERKPPLFVIPACQRLRQHSAYVPAPACRRQVRWAGQMLAYLAMAGRSTKGRNLFLVPMLQRGNAYHMASHAGAWEPGKRRQARKEKNKT